MVEATVCSIYCVYLLWTEAAVCVAGYGLLQLPSISIVEMARSLFLLSSDRW